MKNALLIVIGVGVLMALPWLALKVETEARKSTGYAAGQRTMQARSTQDRREPRQARIRPERQARRASAQRPRRPQANEEKSAGSETKAVSLRVLQRRLRECVSAGREVPETVRHLAGIKTLKGYVADADTGDIILVGKTSPGLPELRLADLVIALRNVWNMYAERKGRVVERSDPGCSIDPNPVVLSRLRKLQSAIFSAHGPEQVEPLLAQYKDIAESPQKVRVLGVPFDTRLASTMVTADYDMKRIVDGSDNLELEGFEGLMDRMLARAKADMLDEGSISMPASMMNRFWFYPGSNTYVESEGVVLIKTCPVTLLTEEQYLNHGGTAVEGTGAANPYAKEFADDFTEYYDRIAEKRPIYTELQNLYRFVALAKILKHKSAITQSGADLDYLFESYSVQETHVSRHLPGRYNLKTFEHRIDYDNGYQTMHAWLPSCGGVGISIAVTESNFVYDKNQTAEKTAKKVIEFRPDTDTLAWSVPAA